MMSLSTTRSKKESHSFIQVLNTQKAIWLVNIYRLSLLSLHFFGDGQKEGSKTGFPLDGLFHAEQSDHFFNNRFHISKRCDSVQ